MQRLKRIQELEESIRSARREQQSLMDENTTSSIRSIMWPKDDDRDSDVAGSAGRDSEESPFKKFVRMEVRLQLQQQQQQMGNVFTSTTATTTSPSTSTSSPPPAKRKATTTTISSSTSSTSAVATPETCRICGEPAARHMHYGAITCFSCKAFFRRAVQNDVARDFLCRAGGNCQIGVQSR